MISIELRAYGAVNETYGHETGDALMRAVARRLRRAQRSGDRLVRYGGPLFVVMCPDVSDGLRAQRRAEEFLAALGEPFAIGDDNILVTANAGITLSDRSYEGAEALVYDASMAMRDAAAEGPGAIALYDLSLRRTLTPSNAEHRLRQAFDDGEFGLVYLPVVSLPDRRLVGVEALLRWSDPERGIVNPADFLKALEDTGLIVGVGEWVLREAARQNKQWRVRHPEVELLTTVNVSPRQLGQADLLESLETVLADTGARPERLCLGISEGALLADSDAAWVLLRRAKHLGLRLALDDFGTGSSSLDSLRRFAVDVLEIDRSFVARLGESPEDDAIVRHIVGLARAMGMVPMAEGVETQAQAALLAALGCDTLQGFLFSTPQPAERINELLGHAAPAAPPDRSLDRRHRRAVIDLSDDGATVVHTPG